MAYTTYNFTDLYALMTARWDDTPFWTEDEAQDALNEALLMWNSLTGQWKARETASAVPDQAEYTLPSSLVFGFRVEYNSRPLTPASLVEMNEGRPGWQASASGTPRKWIPLDLDTIQIWPPPLVAGTLTYDGVGATPTLDHDGTYVQLSSDALGAILGYALHVVAFKEGGDRFSATMRYFQDFLAAASVLNDQLTKSEMFRTFLIRDAKKGEHPTVTLKGRPA
jgi:hypothetical protein